MGGNKNRKTACPANPPQKRVTLHHPDRIRLLARHLVEIQSDIEPRKMGDCKEGKFFVLLVLYMRAPEAGKERTSKVNPRPLPRLRG